MLIVPRSRRRLLIQTVAEFAEGISRLQDSIGLEAVVSHSLGDSGEPIAWLAGKTSKASSDHPWDEAHAVLDDATVAGLESTTPVLSAEPDFMQSFQVRTNDDPGLESLHAGEPCRIRPRDPDWPPHDLPFAWHLGDAFSGLKSAREFLGEPQTPILIGILDTGFDPHHSTLPRHLRLDLARNFTGDGDPHDAVDPASHFPLNNPGHGTATLALLAGNKINPPNFSQFNDFLGGAPYAQVVPIRIADSVVHFATSAMAKGIEYAAQIGCQVLSISMGGIPSQAWAAAVNRAYEAGMTIFAAAGNRIGPLPPATLVYPARFGRVVGVCGFTADRRPYYMPGVHRKMHGCFGPVQAMQTAIAAFTPNVPWAAIGCETLINPDGAGTSSATPQAAAAAALWLQKHASISSEKWRQVEAVRHALFASADRTPDAGSAMFGNGLLRAKQALDIAFNASLPKTPVDHVSFPWLRLAGAFESVNDVAPTSGRQQMFETEALQLFLTTPRLQQLVGNADPGSEPIDRKRQRMLLKELSTHGGASKALRAHTQQLAKSISPSQRPISSSRLVSKLFSSGTTQESIEGNANVQAMTFAKIQEAAEAVIPDIERRGEMIAELAQAISEINESSAEVENDVLSSPSNRLASILQTVLAEQAARRSPSDEGFEFTFDKDDVKALVAEALQRAANVPKHPPVRPTSVVPDLLPDRPRIFLVGDFGTGLYGAPVTSSTIKSDPGRFDLMVHLGDVYYSGEPHEVQERLIDIWPQRNDAISRTLNGNHDMYSGGYGYFDLALPAFGQASSYFAMQNDNWSLLFLDTAYKDNNLESKQVDWINKVLESSVDRKLILFSHHPLFSNFKDQGAKLAAKLQHLLESRRITAWYWGHEHHCVIYDPHPQYGLHARCLGNGGMPSKRKDLSDFQIEREANEFNWRRMNTNSTPSALILDGPNEYLPEQPEKYLPHGYMTIELIGQSIEERVHSPTGEVLYLGFVE